MKISHRFGRKVLLAGILLGLTQCTAKQTSSPTTTAAPFLIIKPQLCMNLIADGSFENQSNLAALYNGVATVENGPFDTAWTASSPVDGDSAVALFTNAYSAGNNEFHPAHDGINFVVVGTYTHFHPKVSFPVCRLSESNLKLVAGTTYNLSYWQCAFMEPALSKVSGFVSGRIYSNDGTHWAKTFSSTVGPGADWQLKTFRITVPTTVTGSCSIEFKSAVNRVSIIDDVWLCGM